jgi:hypothetical protein
MNRSLPCLLAALGLAAGATAPAQAQQATERYIPIGASPGVSGRQAIMGTVVSYTNGVLTISSPAYATPQAVRMATTTRVWLDRSRAQQTNIPGDHGELRPGRPIELEFVDTAKRDVADWVKVQAAP